MNVGVPDREHAAAARSGPRSSRRARAALSLLLAGLVLAPGTALAAAGADPEDARRFVSRQGGYSFTVPAHWQVRGQVLATAFAAGAACESLERVDDPPPPGAGPAPGLHRSLVQICARPLADGADLEGFVRRTYGAGGWQRFVPTEIGGLPALQTVHPEGDRTLFVQSDAYRIQIVTALTRDPRHRSRRREEIRGVLESFAFGQGRPGARAGGNRRRTSTPEKMGRTRT